MSFIETVHLARALLEQEGRVSVRALGLEFGLDGDALEGLVEELVDIRRVAAREGKALVWIDWGGSEGVRLESDAESASATPAQAERRQLTVMFCDLVDSTELSERLGAEELREVISAFQEAAGTAIERFGGAIAQYLGDGLLVYFSYPRAHEDDPLRAVSAGLAIQEAIPQVEARLRARLPRLPEGALKVRVGIHTGPVVIAEMGARGQRERLALGDTVNIASRIQGAADVGAVDISEATRELVRGFFTLEALGERPFRGIARPIPIYRALRESGVRSRLDLAAATGLTPLVGREQELALLLDYWARVCEGHGQVVLLGGEPGIGKSRLVHVLRSRLAGESHTWLECHCSPFHGNTAFFPIVQLLEEAFGLERGETAEDRIARIEAAIETAELPLDEVVPLIADLCSVPLPERYERLEQVPEARRRRTLESLVAWLLQLSRDEPVVLLVEDLHWIDPSTLELLGLLGEQVATAPVFLVLAFRPDFSPPWDPFQHQAFLNLHPLTRQQMRAMVENVAGGGVLSAELSAEVVEKADGVPLYVEELTKSVVESGALPELAIPATLRDSLMARLDRLGPVREVAQLAAVLGREFSRELLAAVADTDEASLEAALVRLTRAELLYQRGVPPRAAFTFKHALIQDTAYQLLLTGQRQEYHARTARALEELFPERAQAEPEVLARHYDEADLPERAVPYYRRAGERATQSSAHAEAIGHLKRGLELVRRLPEGAKRDRQELALQVALGAPVMATQGFADAEVEQVFARAHKLCRAAGDTPLLPRALYGLCTFYRNRGELEPAHELARQLLDLAERSGDPDLRLQGYLSLGSVVYWQGDPAGSVDLLEKAIEVYAPEQHRALAYEYGQEPGIHARSNIAIALWSIGFPDRALARAQEAIELGRRGRFPLGLANGLSFCGIIRHLRGERDEVLALTEELIELTDRHGFLQWLALGRVLRAHALIESQGAPALEELRAGLAQLAGTGTGVGGPYVMSLVADACRALGLEKDAQAALVGAFALSEERGQPFFDAELHRMAGEFLRAREPGEAERRFTRALDIARSQRALTLELRAATSLARMRADSEQREAARAVLAPVYERFTEGFEIRDLRDARALLDAL